MPVRNRLESLSAIVGMLQDKNVFHLIGLNERGAIILRQKLRFALDPSLDIDHRAVRSMGTMGPRAADPYYAQSFEAEPLI
jgi:hypothetical protein